MTAAGAPAWKWTVAEPNRELVTAIATGLGVSTLLARVLVNRGLTVETARAWLEGDSGADGKPMASLAEAVERLVLARQRGERVLVYGDFDADGLTATAVMSFCLKLAGLSVGQFIPDRLELGHGLHPGPLAQIARNGYALVVSVDCGTGSLEAVDAARAEGLDVIITDHHQPGPLLPKAVAVVNPHRADCPYPDKVLAGVGVAYLTGAALMSRLGLPEPADLLDLVAVGTVADIVPLTGINRSLVKRGLEVLNRRERFGLAALCRTARTGSLRSGDILFQLAPRLNAAGRLEGADKALALLLADSQAEALALAAELDRLNVERQRREAEVLEEAKVLLAASPEHLASPCLVLASPGWHPGVLGIVAARLLQEFRKPVVLLTVAGQSARGSGRSVPGFDLHAALTRVSHLLSQFGGHAAAAGLALPTERVPALREALAREAVAAPPTEPAYRLDGEVDLAELDDIQARDLERLEPCGEGNEVPLFCLRGVVCQEARAVGADGNHLKLRLGRRRHAVDAIAFRQGDRLASLAQGGLWDAAFAVELNRWNDREQVQLRLVDLRPSTQALPLALDLMVKAAEYLRDDPYEGIGRSASFYTKVAGVSFEGRQAAAAALEAGQALRLEREPANAADPNAIKVTAATGEPIGYLRAGIARHLAPLMDQGASYRATVSQVTGGGQHHYGVNLRVGRLELVAEAPGVATARSGPEAGSSELVEAARGALLGDRPFRPQQATAIGEALSGKNLLVVFGTGRGKSVVFQTVAAVKALFARELTVIVYPLRALVNDQYDKMRIRLGRLGLNVCRATGAVVGDERDSLQAALAAGECDILLTTPEYLAYHVAEIGSSRTVGCLVVDEGHHIGEASTSRRPAYKRLGELASRLGGPLVLAATATATEAVAAEIVETLGIQRVMIDPHVRLNLQLMDRRGVTDRDGAVQEIANRGQKTLVYVNSRQQAVRIAEMLHRALPDRAESMLYYHGGLPAGQREAVERLFASDGASTVVSTSAFGEGVDINDIRHVAHYHMPFSYTAFNQQSGRAGRDGDTAQIHLLFGPQDARLNSLLLERDAPGREFLAGLYLAIRRLCAQGGDACTADNRTLLALTDQDDRYSDDSVSAGLGVLLELDLIGREVVDGQRVLRVVEHQGRKLDLNDSVRYAEGLAEKAAFQRFREWVMHPDSDLLRAVNQPIYPASMLTKEA